MIRSFFLTSLMGLVLAQTAPAQTDPAAQVQAAMQKVFAGQVESAITDLEAITAGHPEFAPAWSSLGAARRQAGAHEASLEAYQKAIELDPDNAGLMLQTGLAFALTSDVDHAFEWLERAEMMGSVSMAAVDASPAREALMEDPRYPMLFPSEAEFADPFVEDVQVLREWRGETRGDQFGWIARNIGDVDGDGLADVVASAPPNDESAEDGGKIYVYSSGTGKLLWSAAGTDEGGQLGHQVDRAGDVNGDGTPDVVASAPFINKVRVFSGDDGRELFTLTGSDPVGAFGTGVYGIGDVDGDGHDDLLVGEPYQIWGGPMPGGDGSQAGRAYVYSGRDQSVLLTLEGEGPGDGFGRAVVGAVRQGQTLFVVGAPGAGDGGRAYVYDDLDGEPFFIADADEGGNQLGQMFMSIVGDVNADGAEDIYIADWADNSAAPGAGKIYVFSGSDGSRLLTLSGTQTREGFGIGIADASDVDGDGYDDLAVGSWQWAGAAPSGGKVSMHSGRDGSLLYTITGKVPDETLGFDTTGIGDINGDGVPDLLVTSAYSLVGGFQTGRMFILAGKR